LEIEGEPDAPTWLRALTFAARIVFYPLRHPIRFVAIAVIVFMLVNTLRGFVGTGRQISGYVADVSAARQRADAAMSSVSSFFGKRPSQEAAAPQTSPAPVPSPSPADAAPSATPPAGVATASALPAPTATAAAPPATGAAASANEAASATAPTAAPARPAASTPDVDTKAAPAARSAANDRSRLARMPALDDMMPASMHRNSRLAGPCTGGVGGCYWGGTRY
jgi:hypothetical protein